MCTQTNIQSLKGKWLRQVILILFAWKLCYPKALNLARGNHETRTPSLPTSAQVAKVRIRKLRGFDLIRFSLHRAELPPDTGGPHISRPGILNGVDAYSVSWPYISARRYLLLSCYTCIHTLHISELHVHCSYISMCLMSTYPCLSLSLSLYNHIRIHIIV